MAASRPEPGRQLTELWTFFAVDPVAVPLARRLARVRGVTPNRLTALALALGLAAAACLATGRLRTGGALFVLRFFVDCLDGTVARLQGTCSTRGAFADLGADIIGVTAAYAALGWYLVDTGRMGPAWPLAVLGALGLYNWELGHRKRLAAEAGLGTGGAAHRWRRSGGLLGGWTGFCDRHGVSAVPWAVEVEIATLGLAPLLLPADALPAAIATALAFYVLADLLNARRIWRIAGHLDARTPSDVPALDPLLPEGATP
ncbi:CDP-alcohol phosphatidyltransferase family protein [Nocardioides sp. Arc9.136]|uniref:CDP-alcohol phosphatidyltransferase family protein n=1 Tax=Nocardioides sp. Arc9.136 TaxID=2996826 RepID=UPI00266561BA|nr:CDP-alcohol phosphatidyltransferase family protein [Nocardioides sp. Arc9.136]WKN48602.1 CDP-alcohol phosphatidyltransferase family protein [Nocardioides sp. Arc9.136]